MSLLLMVLIANEMTHSSDAHNGDTDSNKLAAMYSPKGALTNESPSGVPPLQDPPSILNRQKNKQSMLQAAASGTKAGVNPFFALGNTNKEGIPAEDFKNIVFLEPTIMVPLKPMEFSGTALKWALQQFTEWFEQAREDLSDNILLILLSYNKSSSKEPEVRKNSMRHLLKEEHQAKMEAHQKVQHEVQDQQEAQLAASLTAMQAMQLQMLALQAQQQPSASS
jgi:hypothetical protein